MCLRSVTNLNLPFFFGTQEIGDTHLGLDVTFSIQPSNNRLFISEFKKVSCLAEKFPLGNSKLHHQ